jgi:hypothetical protein
VQNPDLSGLFLASDKKIGRVAKLGCQFLVLAGYEPAKVKM